MNLGKNIQLKICEEKYLKIKILIVKIYEVRNILTKNIYVNNTENLKLQYK